ncbi:hypothetical protein M3Y94_00397500 [Aphelenchoides besseyi]|nr:hypothetical protein M3Y94_00397500 [Aphelenchoides besseyi]
MPVCKMTKSCFDLPGNVKLPKIIGVMNHVLYALTRSENNVEIWTINVFLPHSWRLRWKFQFTELSYFTATVRPIEDCLYCLFTGVYTQESEIFELNILRINADDETYTKYTSADAQSIFELADLYNLHFETDTLCNGDTDIFIYDRGIVSGSIPFTRFVLNHDNKTFTGHLEPIPNDKELRPTVYGALIDADRKQFVKLTGDNKLRVYDDDSKQWIQYHQSECGNDIKLDDIFLRHTGIGITYDEEYTRFAIVSSPISLLGGYGSCLLSYRRGGRVVFYRVQFDDDEHTFNLRRVALIDHRVAQGYMYCDEKELVVLSKPSYVIALQPLTLKEVAFKCCVQTFAAKARDDSRIRQLCQIQHRRPLI